MDRIDLPLADLSTSLEDAFQRMRDAGRSAIVARSGLVKPDLFVFTAADIVLEIGSKGERLDDVSNRCKVHRAQIAENEIANALDDVGLPVSFQRIFAKTAAP